MNDNKPECRLIGENGNIFNLLALARRALREAGRGAEAEELQARVFNEADSYEAALNIIMEYVEAT